MVFTEIAKKIAVPLIGKQLEKSKIERARIAYRKIENKIEARLGAQVKGEMLKLISEGRYWEALFSLHPILEHRLRKNTDIQVYGYLPF